MNAVTLLILAGASACEVGPPAPFPPVPSQRQLRWHEAEFYGFLHFGINTFTDREWGYGDETPELFAPIEVDARQWARVAKAAGMRGLILTAKHHDGFCLWPSQHTEHSVKHSPWREGKGDLVQEVASACAEAGLSFGVYLSPWDRNHAQYGRPEYVEYYRNQLEELLAGYGPLFEVWFDGANGGDGFYGGARESRTIDRTTYYGWKETWSIVRFLQPMACMFSDGGPDVRWVGNEHGVAGDPCWATQNQADFAPGIAETARLNRGDRPGTHWVPAECDVSIRPGWFHHDVENDKVKSGEQLLELYFQSVGRGANLLLNVPPDRRGLIHESDQRALADFRVRLDAIFDDELGSSATITASNVRGGSERFAPRRLLDTDRETFWCADDGVLEAELMLDFGKVVECSVVRVREYLPLGQRIEELTLLAEVDGKWREVARARSIGSCRLFRFPAVRTQRLRLAILKSAACPALSEWSVY